MADERQWQPTINGIERLHLQRYMWAARWLSATDRVLDVGSGCGYGTYLLALVAGKVLGIDPFSAGVDYARVHYRPPSVCGHVEWRVWDARRKLEDEAPFDTIVCLEMIEHVAEGGDVMETLSAAAAPGATLILSTPCIKTQNAFHVHEYDVEEMRELLLAHDWLPTGLCFQDEDGIHPARDKVAHPIYQIWHAIKD